MTKKVLKIQGIYEIVSPSGKRYIGSSIHIYKRWRDHLYDLKTSNHCNKKLQNAWNKYGEQLQFRIVEVVWKTEELMNREQYWMDLFKCYRYGYNMYPDARSPLGWKHTEETKQKLREINLTPQFRAAHSAVHKGKIVSQETRERQSLAKKGRVLSEETKEKMRISRMKFLETEEGIAHKKHLSECATAQWKRQHEKD